MHKVCAFCAFCGGSRACDFLLLYQPIEKAMWQPIGALEAAARIGSAGNMVLLLKQLQGSWRHAVLDGEHSVMKKKE
jgi:hypothetical protein